MTAPSPQADDHPARVILAMVAAEAATYAILVALQSDAFRIWARQRWAVVERWHRRFSAPRLAHEQAPEVWWQAWCHASGIDP